MLLGEAAARREPEFIRHSPATRERKQPGSRQAGRRTVALQASQAAAGFQCFLRGVNQCGSVLGGLAVGAPALNEAHYPQAAKRLSLALLLRRPYKTAFSRKYCVYGLQTTHLTLGTPLIMCLEACGSDGTLSMDQLFCFQGDQIL
ncbi:hypothetical protein MHYP_G00158670 [Metynnis hypsauchen]